MKACSKSKDNALYPLLPLFAPSANDMGDMTQMPTFDCSGTFAALAAVHGEDDVREGAPLLLEPPPLPPLKWFSMDDNALRVYFNFFIKLGFPAPTAIEAASEGWDALDMDM